MSEEHSGIGGSVIKRLLHCPKSYFLAQGLPNNGTVHSARGTLAHSTSEEVLIYGDTFDFDLGSKHEIDGFEVEVDEKIMNAVTTYVDHVNEFTNPETRKIETTVSFNMPNAPEKPYGKADVLDFDGTTIHCIDYKNGYDYVPVEMNEQLLYYVAAAIESKVFEDMDKAERVRITIVQPNAEGEAIRSAEYPISVVFDFVKRMESLVTTLNKGAEKAPAEVGSWCKWCPANLNATCPVIKAELARIEDMSMQKMANQLEHEELISLWEKKKVYEDFLKNVTARLHLLAQNGEIKELMLETTLGDRTWRDAAEAEDVFRFLGDDRYTKPKLVTPTQIENLLKVKLKDDTLDKTQVAAITRLKQSVATGGDMILRPEGTPKLVRKEVSKNPVKSLLEQDFGTTNTDEDFDV